jgi:hypothetical protein
MERAFGGTFFINGDFIDNKVRHGFMNWDQVASTHRRGFEIGNHYRLHINSTEAPKNKVERNILWLEDRLVAIGVDKPVSISYPGFHRNVQVIELVKSLGYQFARGGCDRTRRFGDYQEGGMGTAYNYVWDNSFNIDCLGMFGKKFGYEEFVKSLDRIHENQVGVFCAHGFVGDEYLSGALDEFTETTKEDFVKCMNYLKDNDYNVIALRDVPKSYDFSIGKKEADEYVEQFVAAYGKEYHKRFRDRMNERVDG